jgi:tRNA (cmo5U34)-methyltransferase
MSPKLEDRIYAQPHDRLVDFEFNEGVARVFPDMIRRSVPGYGTLITLIGLLAEQYAQPGTHLYDLGCSLGAATLAMRRRVPHHDCRIVAIDNSAAMVERCRNNIAEDVAPIEVDVICGDIREQSIENASVVVLNFTLQFLPPEDRLALLKKICDGMAPGGVLLLSEKITFADEIEKELQNSLHLSFKRANGYSDLEISQKRTALENVLIPETVAQHQARLAEAGFFHSQQWFQCFNFVSLLAIK